MWGGGFYGVGLVFLLFLVLGLGFRGVSWFRVCCEFCLVWRFDWCWALRVGDVIYITASLLG